MPTACLVRDATPADAADCADVYAPFVLGSPTSFEVVPPSARDMSERIAQAQREHAWLVAELDGIVVGYAYATQYRDRAAYAHVCESSVYLSPSATGRGLGRALYAALLERLRELGYEVVIAGIVLPNAASRGLHVAMGFEHVGTHPRIGHKFGQYWDVEFLQLMLA